MKTLNQVSASVQVKVCNHLYDQLRCMVWGPVWGQAYVQVQAQVWDQISDQIGAQVCYRVRE